MFTAQEILVGNADYPTEKIADNTRKFRQLGLGYANLGALLMAQGMAYDSDGGRAWAATITALMTGHAYTTSARTAGRMGPFAGYADNAEPMLNVLRMHRAEVAKIDEELVPPELLGAAQKSWDDAVELGERFGVRNSQASVLAPTGTIGLMMDCDTTGIEPDLALTKAKKLVGGGTMFIVNQTIPRALRKLGYSDDQVDAIVAYIDEHKTMMGAPDFNPEHLPVFACSMGDNTIHYMGHVTMMGAVQPFISGAISKTVNMPEEASVEDVEQLHIEAWRLGIKAVAIYRDNCKVAQPLATQKKAGGDDAGGRRSSGSSSTSSCRSRCARSCRAPATRRRSRSASPTAAASPPSPSTRTAVPGELFLNVSKQGSTLAGHHGLVRDLGEPRPPVRRAAACVRRDVHEPPVRAGGHDRRPRPADRHEPRRLPVPQARHRVPALRGAGRDRRAHHRGAHPAHAARGRGGRRPSTSPCATSCPWPTGRRRPRWHRRSSPRSRRSGRARWCSATSAATSCSGPAAVTPARAAAPRAAVRNLTPGQSAHRPSEYFTTR